MDLRNFATGGGGHGEPRFRNVSFGQVGWFVRECTDADPERTLLLPSHGGMQVGLPKMSATCSHGRYHHLFFYVVH